MVPKTQTAEQKCSAVLTWGVSHRGLEPLTKGLKGPCSTIELVAQVSFILSCAFGYRQRIIQHMFDVLYLSPHFDDVVLSCGAQIWDRTQRGEKVLVATVCAAPPPPTAQLSPFAADLHKRWRQAGDFDRAAEDQLAVSRIKATPWHMRFADCIYRRSPGGKSLYRSEADIFGRLLPEERGLIDEVALALEQFERHITPQAEVFIPRTIGRHVDHQLTRTAAEQWLKQKHFPCQYYADYPYAESFPGGEIVSISEAGKQHKIEAIAAYESQLSSFWPNAKVMAEKVNGWSERTFLAET